MIEHGAKSPLQAPTLLIRDRIARERLRAAWIRETDPVKARWLAEDIQLRGMQIVVYVPFGQYLQSAAWRDNLEGLLNVPETVVFWNVSKR